MLWSFTVSFPTDTGKMDKYLRKWNLSFQAPVVQALLIFAIFVCYCCAILQIPVYISYCHFVSAGVSTCQWVSLHVIRCLHISVRVSICHSMCQDMSVCVRAFQHPVTQVTPWILIHSDSGNPGWLRLLIRYPLLLIPKVLKAFQRLLAHCGPNPGEIFSNILRLWSQMILWTLKLCLNMVKWLKVC